MKFLRELIFPLIAVIAAFVIGGIVVALIGDDPIQTYRLLIGSALSWPDGIGYTLFYATPLIFTGLARRAPFAAAFLTSALKANSTSPLSSPPGSASRLRIFPDGFSSRSHALRRFSAARS